MNKNPDFLLIDLFCGAGGTTTGAEASGVCKVIAAVNHDPLAISSHAANHSDVLHLTEDILLADISPIHAALAYWQKEYPTAKTILWASLECTNFSNAKGGLPRDADSRTLANGLFRYVEALQPDYILIENVAEFMSWGPLDQHGRPQSRYEGRDYIAWVKAMQSYGYANDWRIINAADHGAVTIRKRYFSAFWRPDHPFAWPQPTHVKRAAKGSLFQCDRLPWRAVAEVLDFDDLGSSIFDRPRPLVDRTLRRILAGLRKFHTQPSIMTCNTPGYCSDIDQPIGSITTRGHKAIVSPMLHSYYSGSQSIINTAESPAPTCTTRDRFALVTPMRWIDRDFRSGRYQPVTDPAGTLLTRPKINLMTAFLTPSNFDNPPRSIHEPAQTILASRKHINLTTAFLVNPQYDNGGSAVTSPAPTVIASQRSRPLALATAVTAANQCRWQSQPTDTDIMAQIKAFMRANGIADIYMRMLKVLELKRIQGFPDDYILHGPQNEQKKFIGNSVETGFVRAWLRAMAAA